MKEMTQIERMSAVLAGQPPDRPPVSFWFHFPPEQAHGSAAVEAHLDHLRKYDLDFLKVMNDNRYPWDITVRGADDLRRIAVFEGDNEGFGRQLELLRTLNKELSGRIWLVTTIFNSWTVLRRILKGAEGGRHGPPTLHGGPVAVDARISELLAEDRSAVAYALDTIAASLANFARRCVEAGAEGIFLSVRDDWVNTDANGSQTYDEMVRDGDLQILNAASDARCNILHVCGVPQNLEAFAAYPISVINWADRAAGPAIGEVIDRIAPVVCGGVDNLNTLPGGSPDEVQKEVHDALRQAGKRPIIVSPGCTFDPDAVPAENLHAMIAAVRGR